MGRAEGAVGAAMCSAFPGGDIFQGSLYSKVAVSLQALATTARDLGVGPRSMAFYFCLGVLVCWFTPSVFIEHKAPPPVITPPSKQHHQALNKQRLTEDRAIFEEVLMRKQKGC